MHVENIRTTVTGEGERVRLAADVHYRDGLAEEIWYEFPAAHREFITRSGNPWLVLLLPVAATFGEPLRVAAPVDPVLLKNAGHLLKIWKCWYPDLHEVSTEAEPAEPAVDEQPARSAAFFSGGVDSFFTVLHYDEFEAESTGGIDDLLCVWGFDIPLDRKAEFQRMRGALGGAAAELGKTFVDIATNARQSRLRKSSWGGLSHGCALASVALALERRYREALIGSTHGYRDLMPWGSHPLTDPRLSTSQTTITHHGAAFDRVQKTSYIAKSDVAMRYLRVCWKSQSDENCGRCNKCYRTMITLHLLGALDRCPTLRERFDLSRVSRILSANENDRAFLAEVKDLATRLGRHDIAKRIERSFGLSRSVRRRLRAVDLLREKPLVGRLHAPLRRMFLGGCIS